jgi:hypothetical protein
MKEVATQLVKKNGVYFKAQKPGVVRKRIFELAAEIGIDILSFADTETIVCDQVRDGVLEVSSRGSYTELRSGDNPCTPLRRNVSADGDLESHLTSRSCTHPA